MAVYFDVAGERLSMAEIAQRSNHTIGETQMLLKRWGWTAEQVLRLVPPGPHLEGRQFAADRARNEARYVEWIETRRADGEAVRERYHAGVAARKVARKAQQAEAAARAAEIVIPKAITVDGVTDHVSGWASRSGLTKEAIRRRIKSGMDPKDAVTLPKQPPGRKS